MKINCTIVALTRLASEVCWASIRNMKSLERSKTFAVVLLAVGLSSCGYNDIQRADEAVTAAWAEVENQLKRRFDYRIAGAPSTP